MIILNGIGVFKDIAFGTLSINESSVENIEKKIAQSAEEQLLRYETAKAEAINEVHGLYEKTLKELSSDEADIFQVHEMMMNDEDYQKSIFEIIKNEKVNAEYAVFKTSQIFSKMFAQMDDPYMNARKTDVQDVSRCIINHLSGKSKTLQKERAETIIGACDLTPSEVSSLDKKYVKGFVCAEGSACSHASILAKVLRIPAVVGVGKELKSDFDGAEVIIDGFSGKVYIKPDEATVAKYQKKKKQLDKRRELLHKLKGKENITKDGIKIDIFANINNPDELDETLENDPGGIGLFRSEFLYLNRDSYPSEEEQFEIYKNIAQKLNGKNVIIRTFDIGSDKKADYFELPEEKNPAMGFRGIRVSLEKSAIFEIQLRAIYRASAFGNISIMFPMIISSKEIHDIKKHIEKVKAELKSENIPFAEDVKIGAMIETPAAAMVSDDLAKEVDFFSVGTNDLAQYSLAVDRQNSKVCKMFDPHHKAVLRMIKMVADNAHKNGISVGICGEIAADESLTETFLSMGIDKLSMSAPFILSARKKVIETNVQKVKEKLLKPLNMNY